MKEAAWESVLETWYLCVVCLVNGNSHTNLLHYQWAHTFSWAYTAFNFFHAEGNLISGALTKGLIPDLVPQETHLTPIDPKEGPSPGLDLPSITQLGVLEVSKPLPENAQGLVVQEIALAANVSPCRS